VAAPFLAHQTAGNVAKFMIHRIHQGFVGLTTALVHLEEKHRHVGVRHARHILGLTFS
jgi:hypothetical protein